MTEYSPTLEENFAKETIRGSFWNYISFVSGKLLNFVSTLILARLLVPQQFGLVAYCTIAIQYLDIINTSGMDSALISRKDKIEEAANSAFAANVILGIVSFIAAWLAAPSIAYFFKTDEITPLFRLLAVVLPISSFGLVPYTMLLRGLRFQTKLIPDLFSSLAKGLVAIGLALFGFGPWSLIWGQIVGATISTILSWILAKWHPTWRFDSASTRGVLVYGGHITLGEFAGQLRNNVDYIIVGRILGAASLGIYTLSYRIPELIIRSVNLVVEKVAFPLLSQIQSDSESLRSIYFGYVRYIAMFTFPMGFGLALITPLFVESFLSEKWTQVVTPMALVSIALAISSVGFVPGVLYKAINRPEILNWLSLIKIPAIILIVWYFSRWGIVGVAAGQILFACITMSLDGYMVSRIIEFKIIEMWHALVPAIICTISMVFVVGAVEFFLSPSGIIGLFFVALIGAVVFIFTLSFVDRNLTNLAYKALKKMSVRQ